MFQNCLAEITLCNNFFLLPVPWDIIICCNYFQLTTRRNTLLRENKHTQSIFQIHLFLTVLQNSSWTSNLIFLCLIFLPEKWEQEYFPNVFYQSCLIKILDLLCSNSNYILLHNHLPNSSRSQRVKGITFSYF